MEQTTNQRTAAQVRAELARRNITRRQVADHLGCHRTTLWRRLTAQEPFDLDELAGIADLLGVPVSTLLPDQASAA